MSQVALPAPAPSSRSMEAFTPLLTAVVLLLVWEAAVRLLSVPAYLLPPPSTVVTDFAANWRRVLQHSWLTTLNMLVGFGVSALLGIPLAAVLCASPRLERAAYPMIVFLQIVPKIAIAPLFIVWFGFGMSPKVLLVVLLTFFPIVVNAMAGFHSVDPEILEFVRSTGAGRALAFRKIRLPAAAPLIFTGLKISAALATTAAVVAEFVASDSGLGYLLITYNGELKTPMVFATVLILGFIGLALYYLIEGLEHLLLPWRRGAFEDIGAIRQG